VVESIHYLSKSTNSNVINMKILMIGMMFGMKYHTWAKVTKYKKQSDWHIILHHIIQKHQRVSSMFMFFVLEVELV